MAVYLPRGLGFWSVLWPQRNHGLGDGLGVMVGVEERHLAVDLPRALGGCGASFGHRDATGAGMRVGVEERHLAVDLPRGLGVAEHPLATKKPRAGVRVRVKERHFAEDLPRGLGVAELPLAKALPRPLRTVQLACTTRNGLC